MKIFKYDLKYLKGDLIGGFTVAIVALPLALSFGMVLGGNLKAGLYSAIITGILSTIFGGTPAQINGPTGAMTVVLVEVYTKLGIEGLFGAMFIAGILQILFGILRLGKYIHLIPKPVIIGFTNGIAILIFSKMIPYASTNLLLTAITLIIVVFLPMLTKKIPASLVALVVGTLLSVFFIPAKTIGYIPSGLPTFHFPEISVNNYWILGKAGFTLALLGTIESLLASLIVDDMLKTKHHSNREIIGQGIGNTVASLFGALIGTGAIVRSGVNINAGGRTRVSGVVHGLIILVITLNFTSLGEYIPVAVLGSILMGTGIRMLEYHATKEVAYASKNAGIVVVITTLFTVFTDLVIAVAVGTLASMLFFVISMGSAYLRKYEVDLKHKNLKFASYTVEGPLFFGVANAILSKLEMESEDADVIILNLMNMPSIDSSGAYALRTIKSLLEERGKKLYLAGVSNNHLPILQKLNVIEENDVDLFTQRIGDVISELKVKYANKITA